MPLLSTVGMGSSDFANRIIVFVAVGSDMGSKNNHGVHGFGAQVLHVSHGLSISMDFHVIHGDHTFSSDHYTGGMG